MNPKEEALAIGVDAVSSFPQKEGSRVEGLSMKSELRKQVLQEMKALPREQKQFIDQALTERLLQHPFTKKLRSSQPTSLFPHEFQTQELIEQALKDGKKVLIPKPIPKGAMDFVVYHPQQLVKLPLDYWNHREIWKWWMPLRLI